MPSLMTETEFRARLANRPAGLALETGLNWQALTSALGVGSSIVNGVLGSNAAGKASGVQTDAANNNATEAIKTTAGSNPVVTDAAAAAGATAVDSAAAGAGNVVTAGQTAGGNVVGTAQEGAEGVNAGATSANAALNPYATAGSTAATQLNAGVAAGGQFNSTPTMADIQIDPGYAFRLQQGQNALDRSAAARGGALSGGAIKADTDYAQGAASQEYQNAYARYQQNRQNNFNDLNAVSNSGQTAATTQGNNTLGAAAFGANTANTAAQYAGTTNVNATEFGAGMNYDASKYAGTQNVNAADLTTARTIDAGNTAANWRATGANAKAAGILGKANAWGSAVNGVANGAGGLATLLQNPASTGGGNVKLGTQDT